MGVWSRVLWDGARGGAGRSHQPQPSQTCISCLQHGQGNAVSSQGHGHSQCACWCAGCVLWRGLRSRASAQSFTPGSKISDIPVWGWPKPSRAPAWLCKGAEGGKSHPLGTVPQPQEVTVTPGGTKKAGGHPSLELGSCKSFSVNPVEIEFPLSRFAATPTPLRSPLTPTSSPKMTDLLKVTY